MGEVIRVRFGAERGWDGRRAALSNNIRKHVELSMPDRIDRVESIVDATMELMQGLTDPFNKLGHCVVTDTEKQAAVHEFGCKALEAIMLSVSGAVFLLCHQQS